MKTFFLILLSTLTLAHSAYSQSKITPGTLVTELKSYSVGGKTYKRGDVITGANNEQWTIRVIERYRKGDKHAVFAYTENAYYIPLDSGANEVFGTISPIGNSINQPIVNIGEEVKIIKYRQFVAGNLLQKHTGIYYTGVAVQMIGAGAVVGGLITSSEAKSGSNDGKTLTYAGAGLSVIGAIISIISHGKVGAAGRMMNGTTGITLPINGKN